eukprot:9011372-Pyramimonas_sp.AAC.1
MNNRLRKHSHGLHVARTSTRGGQESARYVERELLISVLGGDASAVWASPWVLGTLRGWRM